MLPAVFLDRDGVLIENRPDYVRELSQVSLYPKTDWTLARLHRAGYKIVIVTNQSAVGRGLISLHIANQINNKLVRMIRENGGEVDGVYLCPHLPSDACDCRKPKPGLILSAVRDLSLDLSRSWMIGDAWSDLLAGQTAGIPGLVLVKTGRGADQLLLPKPDGLKSYAVFENLTAAVDAITARPPHPG